MVQVSLVQMPYSAVVRPSISLGLLRSYLREHAIEAKVVYANLAFAERIGIEVYRLIENTPANSLIGEWTFAASAFRTPAKGSRDFLRKVGAGFADPYANFIRHRYTLADVEGVIEDVRESADRFVDDVAEQVLATRPRIVGCTSMFQQHCASLALLRRIKELAPDVTTMLGGANCEGPMGEQAHRSFPWVDFVASGEADEYFGALCRHILDEGRTIPIEALPEGVWAPAHRAPRDTAPPTPAGKVGVSLDRRPPETPAARSIVNDLDRLAVPDFDDYFEALEHSYLGRYIDPALPLETSRGCWWGQKHHCTFCGLNGAGMTYRKKSPERAQREIEALTERYGIYNLSPTDNILEMSYLTSLLPALAESGPRYALFYEVKPNLRRPQLETLAAAGARWLQPGIESLHDEVLKLLDKGVSALNNVQLLKWGLELGIRLEYYILYGAPGERDEWHAEVAEWLPLIAHLQPPNCTGRIRYDRFSPYYIRPETFGIHLEPCRTYAEVYPLAGHEIANLAYYFEDYSDATRGRVGPERDGLRRLVRRVQEWRQLFSGREGARPVLIGEDQGDALRVIDTRPVAIERCTVVTGVRRAALAACEDRTTEAAVVEKLSRGEGGVDYAEADVRAALRELCERKWLLALNGKLLSLVTAPAEAPLPTVAYAPAGIVDHRAASRDPEATSVAARRQSSVRDLPLQAFLVP